MLGCGVAQLAPNVVTQISGVIVRCHELEKVPTVDLLLPIFRVKNVGSQLYLNKKPNRVRLVDVRPSHTGWHEKRSSLVGLTLTLLALGEMFPSLGFVL